MYNGLHVSKDYLWQRGRQWYLRLSIPLHHRRFFLSSTGKPLVHIVEPLGSDHEAAKRKAAQRYAWALEVFHKIKIGAITTPAQAKEELREPYENDPTLHPNFEREWLRMLNSPEQRERERRRRNERIARAFEEYGESFDRRSPGAAQPAPTGETISQAAEAWLAELTRDKNAAPRDATIEGHRQRVRKFVDKVGDLPLTEVTRATANDFLAALDNAARTRNIYADTLKRVFKSAGRRGRFSNAEENNPFHDQRVKVARGSDRVPFTVAELQTLFDALPRDIKPKKHTPETALPWVALIAAYTGACLEEICQLTLDDIREEDVNGGRLWCIDIHNGDDGHKLKNEKARPRLLPMHSQLAQAGLLAYIANLPDKRGQLFPGLKRRTSKGGKVGARVGELFRKKRVALDLKRKGLCFHSLRHTVAGRLDAAGVPQSDAARVLGHAVAGMSYGTYSQGGPGLIRVKDVVEKITYEGLRL
jgi:integrase